MNETQIRVLAALLEKSWDVQDLADALGKSRQQIIRTVRDLEEREYAILDGAAASPAKGYKIALLRDILKTADIRLLLRGSCERVLAAAADETTIEKIAEDSGVSRSTAYKSVMDLRSAAALTKDGPNVKVSESNKSIGRLARVLRTEFDSRYEGRTEIIYNSNSKIIRRVPAGRTAPGAATAFTVFADLGIMYRTTHDYFCEQKGHAGMHDILIHSVYAAKYLKSAMNMTMCIIFYIKHREQLNIAKIRKKASEFGVLDAWLDAEAYLRRGALKNPKLFLPWREFEPKAGLYGIPSDAYRAPAPDNLLWAEIGACLQREVAAYLLGGENMRLKGLKDSTKDCDILVENREDFDEVSRVLRKMGYIPSGVEPADADTQTQPSEIFAHSKKPRIDLFTGTVLGGIELSDSMKSMADIASHGLLKLGLLKNEHVFVLKAAAGREGDIQDMKSLALGFMHRQDAPRGMLDLGRFQNSFDWNLVWSEILEQERINPIDNLTVPIFEQIAYLAEQAGIAVPILGRLRLHAVGSLIKKLLRQGKIPVRRVINLLKGGDITETLIRNKIASMTKAGDLLKSASGRAAYIQLPGTSRFPKPELKLTLRSLELYLGWRFPLMPVPPTSELEDFMREMRAMNISTIGELDDAVLARSGESNACRSAASRPNSLGAIQACIGLPP